MFETLRHKDPLQQVKNPHGLVDYVAFETRDRSRRLRIRRAEGAAHSPDYRYLLDISYDDKTWLDFVLTYSFMQVQVRGKNLQDIIIGIETNACLWIQEFDPQVYSRPKPDAPIIESIEIITPDSER